MHLPLFLVAKKKKFGGQNPVRRTDAQTERTSRSVVTTRTTYEQHALHLLLLLARVKEREANIQLSQLLLLHTIVMMRCEVKGYLGGPFGRGNGN